MGKGKARAVAGNKGRGRRVVRRWHGWSSTIVHVWPTLGKGENVLARITLLRGASTMTGQAWAVLGPHIIRRQCASSRPPHALLSWRRASLDQGSSRVWGCWPDRVTQGHWFVTKALIPGEKFEKWREYARWRGVVIDVAQKKQIPFGQQPAPPSRAGAAGFGPRAGNFRCESCCSSGARRSSFNSCCCCCCCYCCFYMSTHCLLSITICILDSCWNQTS